MGLVRMQAGRVLLPELQTFAEEHAERADLLRRGGKTMSEETRQLLDALATTCRIRMCEARHEVWCRWPDPLNPTKNYHQGRLDALAEVLTALESITESASREA